MPGINSCRKDKNIIWPVILGILIMAVAGCNRPTVKVFTIGIVGSMLRDAPVLKGFREGMGELGYIEGKNIKYVFREVLENDEKDVDAGIKEVLAQDVDILLTLGGGVCLRGKELVKGTDTPLLFSGEPWPVEKGLVETLARPGGNITGVRCPNSILKALEWLQLITVKAKKFYAPYNPDDKISVAELPILDKTARQLGIELIFHEVHSVEEVLKAIDDLTEDFDAVFMLPSPTLNPESGEIGRAAIKRGIPTGAPLILDESVLITFSNDYFDAGKKTARMADQIHLGVKPADLPVETTEVILIVNMKTAEEIGLAIPDAVLTQAKTIIR